MAIKGTGFNDSTIRNQTIAAGDTLEVDGQITVAQGVNVTTGGVTVTAGGLDVTAGGLAVSAGGASIVGNSSISGNLTVSGTLISQDEQQVLVKDNFLDLNFGYVGTSYEQTGLTFNYQATSAGVSIDTSANSVTFTAGTTTARAKVVASQVSDIPAATFADGDIVQINGTTNADNDGIYVVQANGSAGTVEFKSSTLSSPDSVNAAFALLNVTTETESTATALTIRKVTLMALRASNAGALQSATGSTDGSFASYDSVGADTTLQEAYDAGASITTDASGAITFTLSADNQGLSVQGSSGGNGSVSIGGTTAVNSFVVGASGAASSITSTGQNLTLQTATSGQVVLRSAGVMTVDSDDSMTIQMDANDGSAKALTIQSNNAGGGEGNIALDADDNVNSQIAGTTIWGIDSDGAVLYGGKTLAITDSGNSAQYILMNGADGSIAFDQANGTANVVSKTAAAAADDLEIKVLGNFDASLILESQGSGADALKLHTTTNAGGIDIDSVGTFTCEADDIMTIKMDASSASNKNVSLISNNTGSGEGNIVFDADDNVNVTIGGTGRATITSAGLALQTGSRVNVILDEDDMSSNDATGLATQQSIKAYVDNQDAEKQSITQLVDGSGGAISAGDVVAINGSGQAIQADADAESTCRVIGICVSTGGGNINIQQVGNISSGLSGLTAGDRLFASTTAGGLTSTAPSGTGDVVFQVGYATSTSAMVLAPMFIMEIG